VKDLDIDKFKDYLYLRDNVIAAYLFGLYVPKRLAPESDARYISAYLEKEASL